MSSEQPVISTTSVALSPDIGERARASTADLVVLPSKVEGDGPVYSEHSVMLVKQLKALGAEVTFADPSEERRFEVKKGALTTAALALVIGIGSNASWDFLKKFLRREKSNRLSITYVALDKSDGSSETAWLLEGDSESVIQSIDRLRGISHELSSVATEEPPGVESPDARQPALPAAGSDEDLHKAYLVSQVLERRSKADRLMEQARSLLADASNEEDLHHAEVNARNALAAYRSSLDWAEDTDREEDAHRRLDEAGHWVRETFGCFLDRDGKSYKQTCPVALGHNRIGLSISGRASVRVCSLCGRDVSECEHLPGTAYLVPGGASDLGWCRVCCQSECDHVPTEMHRAPLVSIIRQMDLDEISIVSRPAHPDARIQAVSVPVADLQDVLGDSFIPGMEVSCDRCLLSCEGLVRHDVPHD
jgi:hypothetical protein